MSQKPSKPPFYLIDTSHSFYRPLSTRVIIVALVSFWAVVEVINEQGFFMIIAIALAAYCANALLISYKPPVVEDLPAASVDEDVEEEDQELSKGDDATEAAAIKDGEDRKD